MLVTEAAMLVLVCFGYGFARQIFPDSIAFFITCALYLVDQMLMSVSMARAMYIKKIALKARRPCKPRSLPASRLITSSP